MKSNPLRRWLAHAATTTTLALGLAACGGDSSSSPTPAVTYRLGGTVSGLAAGASVVLQDAAAGTATVSANGAFAFTTRLEQGKAYDVSVKTPPTTPAQDCTVTGGKGTMGGADVNSISVTCVAAVPLSLTIKAPTQATMGTLVQYTVTEANGMPLTGLTWTFDGTAGGHALTGLANGIVQVWNAPGAHTIRVVATASGGRSGEATASTGVIGAPLVSANFSSCALTPAGEVRCWGYNGFGALGNTGNLVQATPLAVAGLTGLVGLAGGYNHMCGLKPDRDVLCWGNNLNGQLGDPATLTIAANPTPVLVAGLHNVVSVVAGSQHTCALKSDRTVVCFGDNTFGQLGIGTAGGQFATPQAVVGLSNVVALSSGRGAFTCALKADGAVVCWGDNQTGQQGDGTRSGTPRPSPGPVLTASGSALTGVLALRSASDHSCAIVDDGNASVVCWGYNGTNQTSSGNLGNYPATPVPGLTGTFSLALTDVSTCASGFGGSFICWGDNFYAESNANGVGGDTVVTPAAFPGLQGAQQPIYASGGNTFLCALMPDGGGRCVGRGNDGELGQGTAATALTLQTVAVPAGTFWH